MCELEVWAEQQAPEELTGAAKDVGRTQLPSELFQSKVNEIAWNMTGEMFFLTTGNGTVEVLAHPSLRHLDTLMAHTAGCYCIAIDPVGRYFAVGSADSLVSLWDISEMLCARTFTKLE
ncbi:hypothetical protein L6164_030937 [Bauhinia variegata]|uniref:Uncharacterized protein n=1 Tax=Bauhinia variegata TaxID=167791 RepID=A0ACB9LE91_BAUVA|nr:hypothetical protein L6164_030937 [Bauhinia variegata]